MTPDTRLFFMPDFKDQIKAQFGQAAQAYVASPEHATGEDLRRAVEVTAPQGHEILLDVATGGGHTALAFAPYVKEVVVTDLTQEMLKTAQEFLTSRGVANARYQEADAENLPFPDQSFDLVTCRIAPHHFQKILQALAEFHRGLKPEGRLLIVDSLAPDQPLLDEFINRAEWLRDHTHVRSYNFREWKLMLERVGFEIKYTEVFRREHNFELWTNRMKMAPEDQENLELIFLKASPAAKEYFELKIENNRLISYTDDKLLIMAVKV